MQKEITQLQAQPLSRGRDQRGPFSYPATYLKTSGSSFLYRHNLTPVSHAPDRTGKYSYRMLQV